MTDAKPMGDNMRVVMKAIAAENNLTFDQLLRLMELIMTGKKEEAVMLAIEMMGRKKDLIPVFHSLEQLDLTAAKKLLPTGDKE